MVRNPPLFRQALLTALIADRPEDDRRVVAIAANHRAKILLRPLFEKRSVPVWFLGIGPCISKLIHNEKAHPVTKVQKLLSRRIMRSPDSIAAHFFESLEPLDPYFLVPSSPESTGIMMETDPFDESLFTIEIEPVWAERGRADSKRRIIFSGDLPFLQKFRTDYVHRRVFRAPKAYIF